MSKKILELKQSKATPRLYSLDWLRVLAMFVVFFFHSLRFFTIEDWVVKNPTTYLSIENFANYLESWMMPLIFVVSGASVFFATQKNKPVRKFFWNKVLRLLVPLLVGIFTHSILQVYMERVSHGEFNGSFWAFLPHYFEGLYKLGGNFAWMGLHLWYLEVLFVFSIIFLPVILLLRREKGKQFLTKMGSFLAKPGAIYCLVLVAILLSNVLDPDSILGKDIFGWPLVHFFSFFLAGYVLVSNGDLMPAIQRSRWISMIGSLLTSILFFATQDHKDVVVWFVILMLLGFGSKHLNFSSSILDYANPAILPFYILHQPVLLCVGFFVVQWQIPAILKYLTIAIPSLILTVSIYEFLIRRNNLLRLAFGMKIQKHSSQLGHSFSAISTVDGSD